MVLVTVSSTVCLYAGVKDMVNDRQQKSIGISYKSDEMLTQSVRHEVYLQTKNIRELLYARSLATSVIVDDESEDKQNRLQKDFNEDEILKDWFDNND